MKPAAESSWEDLISLMIVQAMCTPADCIFTMAEVDPEIVAAIEAEGFEWKIDTDFPKEGVFLMERGYEQFKDPRMAE